MLQRCVNGTNCSRDRKRGHMSFVVRAQLPAQNFCLELFVFFFFLGKLEFSPAKVAPPTTVCFVQSKLTHSSLFLEKRIPIPLCLSPTATP
jgi:hypothetical protein